MRFAYVILLGIIFGTVACCLCRSQSISAADVFTGAAPVIAGAGTVALEPAADPAALVRAALEAEASGDVQSRDANLQRAIELNPDFAPAHWQLGEVLRDGRWVKVEAAARESAQAGMIERYRRLRAVSQPTLNDQLAIARWCELKGLPEQQRVHLVWALMLDPNCREATEKLGMVWVAGNLVPKDLVGPLQEQAKEEQLSTNQWSVRLRKLQNRSAQHGSPAADALNELRSVQDPAAIPWLERIFGNGDSKTGLAVVECLSRMRQQEAVESLVRFAVLSPHSEVRDAAAEALQSRDTFAYVPMLIEALDVPIRVAFRWFNQVDRVFGHHLTLTRETPQGQQVYVSTSTAAPDPSSIVPGTLGRFDSGIAMRQALADAKTAERTAVRALQVSEQINEMNRRIIAALRVATGKDFGDDPARWSKWWHEDNGYYTPPEPEKPEAVVNSRYYNYRYVALARPRRPAQSPSQSPTASSASSSPPLIIRRGRGNSECCAAGTPVWTVTGPMAIEEIEVGELVMAQDAVTGELAYKPVIATTVRPPTELVEMRVGNTVVRTTPGHLFWEIGTGWKMAKDIFPGTWIRCLRGPVQVDRVEPFEPAPTYNLVVADYNTYVIADALLLVHDNNLRGPNTFAVPGLAKE